MMAPVKFKSIISFSSEDPNYPADNLLLSNGFKKWLCKEKGETQAYVIFQLEKALKISSVDIGNEGSAFIEVMVARGNDDYKTLIATSSFMTVTESKNEETKSRVRMFGGDKLAESIAKEKWDRVKVVCSQPFNKHMKYGISFIKMHSSEESSGSTNLGAFKIKEDKDDLSIGSFFSKRKEKKADEPLSPTGVAAIRAASTLAAVALASAEEQHETVVKRKIRQSNEPNKQAKVEENSKPSLKRDRYLNESPIQKPDKGKLTKPKRDERSKLPRRDGVPGEITTNNTSNKQAVTAPKTTKPFKKLLDGVVFVLSGFVNPERSDLRDKATEMGAKYKSDWGTNCTHLVCAFSNTPKYKQVVGKGKIVKKEWINDCHANKIRYPWRRYELVKSDAAESDEEIFAEEVVKKEDMSDYGSDTDVEGDDSGADTEDEIKKIEANSKVDPYDVDTDIDDDDDGMRDTSSLPLPPLPKVFTNKHFFLCGDFCESDIRILRRNITYLNGKLEDYMGANVNFVISNTGWNCDIEEFQDLNDSSHLIYVKPSWINECVEKEKMVPYEPYVITPDT